MKFARSTIVVLAAFTMVASHVAWSAEEEFSGFLDDYSQFQPGPDEYTDWLYVAPVRRAIVSGYRVGS